MKNEFFGKENPLVWFSNHSLVVRNWAGKWHITYSFKEINKNKEKKRLGVHDFFFNGLDEP